LALPKSLGHDRRGRRKRIELEWEQKTMAWEKGTRDLVMLRWF